MSRRKGKGGGVETPIFLSDQALLQFFSTSQDFRKGEGRRKQRREEKEKAQKGKKREGKKREL